MNPDKYLKLRYEMVAMLPGECVITGIIDPNIKLQIKKTIIYFENNCIVVQKSSTKKIFNVNDFPRIFFRHRTYEEADLRHDEYWTTDLNAYDLFIQQNDNIVVIETTDIDPNKIIYFLNNIEFRSKNEISTEQWNKTASSNEKKYSYLNNYLDKRKKVVGVKGNNAITIKKGFSSYSNYLTLILLCIFIIGLLLLGISFIKQGGVMLISGIFFILLTLFASSFVLYFGYYSLSIKIKFTNDTIKIGPYNLDYKNKDIKFSISRNEISNNLYLHNITDRYTYFLHIYENEKNYSIKLDESQFPYIQDFVDRLILQ